MNILESLMTPGCLVRFGQQHGGRIVKLVEAADE